MSAELLWRLIAETAADPKQLAARVVESFGESSSEEIAVAFDVALRAGALDRNAATRLLTHLAQLRPEASASDLIALEVTTERLRNELADASKRHGVENVTAADEAKRRLDRARDDLADIEKAVRDMTAQLETVHRLASEVRP